LVLTCRLRASRAKAFQGPPRGTSGSQGSLAAQAFQASLGTWVADLAEGYDHGFLNVGIIG
jgi:hypothetical protein